MYYFINHDIVYGCKKIVEKCPKYEFTMNQILTACNKKSLRIVSFLFKHNNYDVIKSKFPLFFKKIIIAFVKNSSFNQLRNLLIEYAICNNGIKNLLICIFTMLENLLEMNDDICNSLLMFLSIFAKHFDLKIMDLFGPICELDDALYPCTIKFLKNKNFE